MSFDRHHVCRLATKDCTTIANAMKCLILGFLAHGGISNIADDDEEDEGPVGAISFSLLRIRRAQQGLFIASRLFKRTVAILQAQLWPTMI